MSNCAQFCLKFSLSAYRNYQRVNDSAAWRDWLPNYTWKYISLGTSSHFWAYWWTGRSPQVYELAQSNAYWFWRVSNGRLSMLIHLLHFWFVCFLQLTTPFHSCIFMEGGKEFFPFSSLKEVGFSLKKDWKDLKLAFLIVSVSFLFMFICLLKKWKTFQPFLILYCVSKF